MNNFSDAPNILLAAVTKQDYYRECQCSQSTTKRSNYPYKSKRPLTVNHIYQGLCLEPNRP